MKSEEMNEEMNEVYVNSTSSGHIICILINRGTCSAHRSDFSIFIFSGVCDTKISIDI